MGDETEVIPRDEIWADDLLGRRGDALFLRDFIRGKIEERKRQGQTASYVINIDAEWGAGKSFFLDRFAVQLQSDGYVVARVNAWRDDHIDDPFIAVLASIDQALKPYTNKQGPVQAAWKGVKKNAIPVATKLGAGITKTLLTRYVGKDAIAGVVNIMAESSTDSDEETESSSVTDEVLSSAASELIVQIEGVIDAGAQKLIETFNAQNAATDTFRQRLGHAMESLAKQKSAPLFILVDELDRCRPSYAIALLERVKHLFDADNVAFVFATNSGELRHIIAGAYGPSFDGFSYLKRFFDRTYLLGKPDIERFVDLEASVIDESKFRSPIDFMKFLKQGFGCYESSPREIKHALDLISSTAAAWSHNIKIETIMILPLVMSFIRSNSVDIPIVVNFIPKNFIINYYQPVDYYGEQSKDRKIDVRAAFGEMAKVMQDLSKAPSYGEQGNSALTTYVRDSFVPEWNGRSVQQGTPSVQTDLARLIAHAGKFRDDNEA